MIKRIKTIAFLFLMSLSVNSFANEIIKKEVFVNKGDSLIKILKNNNISPNDIEELIYRTKNSDKLKSLKIGQKIILYKDKNILRKLVVETDSLNVFVANKKDDKFTIKKGVYKTDIVNQYEIGKVSYSLNKTLISMNLNTEQRKTFQEMFKNQLNLNKIKKGTDIIVVFENIYKGDEKIGQGDIVAAEISYNDEVFQSFVFNDHKGNKSYYKSNGEPLIEGINRTPLKSFSRVSSVFTPKRKHPVLGYTRSHNGVDYASETGTPIYAAASGRIAMKDYKKNGYGKFLVINHENGYSTLYAHMNKFNEGMYSGKEVRKGDLIGYVGSTGLSTGPHLHFEIRKDGKYLDPQKTPLPNGNKIAKSEVPNFRNLTKKFNEGFKISKMVREKEGKTKIAIRNN